MKRNLFIFIGGSDDQNGDYSDVHRLAERGGSAHWSSLKGARPGDRALIYIRNPHSALIAKAEVLADPVKGEPGDYAYRAKTGRFEPLPNQLTIKDLKRAFPRWNWLWFPRRNGVVPDRYAKRLWSLVHVRQSSVQILINKAGYDKSLVERLAVWGGTSNLTVPRLTAVGDTVLFYLEGPVSAIVAVGKVLSRPRPTKAKRNEARVGKVRLLDSPITLVELRTLFPDWVWLRSVNMYAYVSAERARRLVKRCALSSAAESNKGAKAGGGGFGDAKNNALVEKAAVSKVTKLLKGRGFRVRSLERERIGYDLHAIKGKQELHVEVKGVSGDSTKFLITRAELARATSDPAFRLVVVTKARTRLARVHDYHGRKLKKLFAFTPVSYFAEKR